MKKPADKTVYN